MNKTYYVCKYTPIELLESLGGECENFNHMPEGFDLADQVSHPNICGFWKNTSGRSHGGENQGTCPGELL